MNKKKPTKNTQITRDQQVRIAENYLLGQLDKICELLHIRLVEWDLNEKLFSVIVEQIAKKRGSHKLLRELTTQTEIYDHCYKLNKKLHINVKPRYRWFLNLGEFIQNK